MEASEEYMTELMRRNRDSAKLYWGNEYDSELCDYITVINRYVELHLAVRAPCTIMDAVMFLVKLPSKFTTQYSQQLLFAAGIDLIEGVK